ncbi:MAG: hypothetical protein ACUVQV_02915 [Dissulfurimicrobium sp.]|uniref:hypothetical protein n=1 Tax=Dissulfurimicrobium sp. TaxID=2022436 RepID=UPI0040499EA9
MQTIVPNEPLKYGQADQRAFGTLALEMQALYEISLLIRSAVFFDKTLSEILRVLH